MRKIVCFLLTVLVFLGYTGQSHAQIYADPIYKEKRKEPKKKSKYEKILKDHKSESSVSSFLGLYKIDGKVYLDLPIKELGQDLLMGVTVSSVSDPEISQIGFKYEDPIHVRFSQKDSVIVLSEINDNMFRYQQTAEMNKSLDQNYQDVDLTTFPIKAYNADSTSVVLDLTNLFLTNDKLFPSLQKNNFWYRLNVSARRDLSHIEAVKTFEDNACIKFSRTYMGSISWGNRSRPLDMPIQIGLNFSILKLPKEIMTPRLADSRIGYFQSSKAAVEDGIQSYVDLIHRWRLEPCDSLAVQSGKLSKVKKPIVFYVEDTFPKMWQEAIKLGVLKWNKAFEKIGFKEAVQVKPFPKDDPNFDPDNLKYSCFRYLPVRIPNAMGPSWVDPRSGEIINATVLVYNDIVQVLNHWRFVQTAQLDKRVRSVRLPEQLMKESLAYVFTHEVGHTLGLMHNMGASSAIPVDSLRSVSFTHKYGTTPSIMDYARYNYVAQVEDKGVALAPPSLGVYDFFAIRWGYQLFPESKGDCMKEHERLSQMLREKEGNKWYRYGVAQYFDRYDPSSIEEDLGDDPVKASTYGLKNIHYIMDHLPLWFPAKDDETSEHKAELYNALLYQSLGYISNVAMNLGGVYLAQTSEGSGLPRYQVVPRDKQVRSLIWLLEQISIFDQLVNKSLERKLYASNFGQFKIAQERLYSRVWKGLYQVARAYDLDSKSLSPLDFCEALYQYGFASSEKGQASLSKKEQRIQELLLKSLLDRLNKLMTGSSKARHHLSSFDGDFRKANPFNCSPLDIDGLAPKTQTQYALLNFGRPYGIAEPVRLIDNLDMYFYSYLNKIEKTLEKARARATKAEMRQHYDYLLYLIRTNKNRP